MPRTRARLKEQVFPYLISVNKSKLDPRLVTSFWILIFIPFCVGLSFYKPSPPASLLTSTPDYFNTALYEFNLTVTPSAFPSVTPSPVFTVIPSAFPSVIPTPVLVSLAGSDPIQEFNLSFYDPEIGRYFLDNPEIALTNCLEYNFETLHCDSKVNRGRDNASNWYGKGAACPVALLPDTVFQVVSPPELIGFWRCIDVGLLDRGDYHYIDFMLEYPHDIWTGDNLDNFPWSSIVQIKIISYPQR